ncbi:kallikrein-14 isoform X2 [Ailuropoda melanoleuca]|uniref:kallikrein-14 isoform X2 n=1 Tax=Ailuropoda melanoleuca TaxID=9646 RepID=UPI001494052E|nr:kallikrein-14 isoform X2 [Ailuropoda melanoleuca]
MGPGLLKKKKAGEGRGGAGPVAQNRDKRPPWNDREARHNPHVLHTQRHIHVSKGLGLCNPTPSPQNVPSADSTPDRGSRSLSSFPLRRGPAVRPVGHHCRSLRTPLERPARLGRAVRPIAIASSCAGPGTPCHVSGWGTTSSPIVRYPNSLQCVNINISSDQECRQAYSQAITAGMVCAGSPQGGKDSCQGDSGGPLVCKGQLQGLVSWGMERCALPGYPGVYTNLCKYQTWIQKTIQSN